MVRYAVTGWDPLGDGSTGLMVYNGNAWVAYDQGACCRPTKYRITYEVLETKELGDITFAHSEVLVPWTAEIET